MYMSMYVCVYMYMLEKYSLLLAH